MKIKTKLAIIYFLIYLVIIVSLLLQTDLFISNLSGLTVDRHIHLIILAVNILNGINIYLNFKPLFFDKGVTMVAGAFIISAIIPYGHEPLMMNLHIMFAYGSFILLNVGYYRMLLKLALFDQGFSSGMMKMYMILLTFMAVLYMVFMAVNGLMEMIYLTALTVQLILILITIEKANNKC